MSWIRYPEYKPSGVEWLGEIPAHWDINKLRHIASVRFSNVDKNTVKGEQPVRLCNYMDVYHNDFITDSSTLMEATASPAEIARFTLREGDVIITKDSEDWNDIAVPAYVLSDLQGVLCGYHLAQIRPNAETVDGKYLFRAFCSRGINDQFRIASTGITRYGLGKYWLDSGLFLVPPLSEQRAIAAFLDRETSKIDVLVAKKKRLIELLQEKRTALITHAVTQGLDPTAPTKPSGIDWLGDIPAHWEVKRLPRVLRIQEGPGIMANDFHDDGVPLLRVRNLSEGAVCLDGCNFLDPEKVKRQWKQFRLEVDDLLISGSASMGMVSVVGEAAAGAIPYTGIFRFQPLSSEAHSGFVRHFLVSTQFLDQVNTLKTGVGIKHFGPTHLARVHIAVPPREEQAAIAASLDSRGGRIHELIGKVEAAIAYLKEFRTALVSAAVTGKIDVREEVAS